MGLEREHKWLVAAFPDVTRLEAAFAAEGVATRPATVREQHDTYFDTPERQLLATGAALRVRRFDAETLATYKGPGAVVGSLHAREEIEVPFTRPWPEAVGAKLASLGVAAARLVPVLDLHTTRTRYLLHGSNNGDAAPVAELSFDEVRAVHGERSVQFRELELEAQPDTPDATLARLGAVLSAFDLTPHEGDKLTYARAAPPMTLHLILIRHAHAGESNHDDPSDHLRPLSRKGQRQADTLSRALPALGLRFDRLFSSPYTRAAETAAPLLPHVRGGRLELLGELTGDDHAGLLEALRHTLKKDDATVGLVGHEPYLSRLTSTLLCGEPGRVRTRFRKGMIVRLGGPLAAGRMELHSALTPTLLRGMAETV